MTWKFDLYFPLQIEYAWWTRDWQPVPIWLLTRSLWTWIFSVFASETGKREGRKVCRTSWYAFIFGKAKRENEKETVEHFENAKVGLVWQGNTLPCRTDAEEENDSLTDIGWTITFNESYLLRKSQIGMHENDSERNGRLCSVRTGRHVRSVQIPRRFGRRSWNSRNYQSIRWAFISFNHIELCRHRRVIMFLRLLMAVNGKWIRV